MIVMLKNEIYRNNRQDRYKIWSSVFFKITFKKLVGITESLWFKDIERAFTRIAVKVSF